MTHSPDAVEINGRGGHQKGIARAGSRPHGASRTSTTTSADRPVRHGPDVSIRVRTDVFKLVALPTPPTLSAPAPPAGLRRPIFQRVGYRCEACGAVEDRETRRWLEVYERWHYDDRTGVQSLRRLIALCSP